MTMAGVKWFNIWVLNCMYNDHLKTKCGNMAKVANLLLNATFNSLSQKNSMCFTRKDLSGTSISAQLMLAEKC